MFLSRNKKNNVYPCKPKFYYILVTKQNKTKKKKTTTTKKKKKQKNKKKKQQKKNNTSFFRISISNCWDTKKCHLTVHNPSKALNDTNWSFIISWSYNVYWVNVEVQEYRRTKTTRVRVELYKTLTLNRIVTKITVKIRNVSDCNLAL